MCVSQCTLPPLPVKVRRIESAGGIGAVIIDNTPGTSSSSTPLFSMSDDGKGDDIKIPALFLYEAEGRELLGALDRDPDMDILLSHGEKSSATQPSGTTTTTRTLSSPQTAADRKESEGVPKEIVIEEGEGSSTERSIEELRKTTSSVLVSVDRNLKELLEQFPSKEGLASLPARPQTGGPPAGNGAEREAMYNQLQQALQQQSQLESLDKELQRLKAISNLDVEEMASLERLQEEFKRLNDELEHLMSDILQARETKEPVKNDEL
ncbi:unnamed protein product [Cyprideis torosa]|uniref:PA domain-containing protein n=1 Tax=Cyprideis torosa TaxID=163714 RepID=A0A7R8ZK67_9CRUS|nr:unnamed protein product [Cyprideis torosa]CAG0890119.1 unnamed protein product [Cyprideis torosa]